jgi:hypothetical protein
LVGDAKDPDMSDDAVYRVLRTEFRAVPFFILLGLGVVIGFAGGTFGASGLFVRALRIGTGLNELLVCMAVIVSLFSLAALVPGRTGELGRGDFGNFHGWVQRRTFRAASVLTGFAVAAVAWWIYGSHELALACALIAFILAGSLWYCWGCIVLLAAHFEEACVRGTA